MAGAGVAMRAGLVDDGGHDETAMAHQEFYRQALYYDIAFAYRDVPKEVSFFEACFDRHAKRPLRSVLEIASGPGYHAIEAARRGRRAHALDLSPEMIQILRDKARAQAVDVQGIVADMTRFKLDQKVDLALNLLTSISYLLTDEALLEHFGAVAACLEDGGLYIVENNHPRDFWSGDHFKPSNWREERDGIVVETTWCAVPPKLHLVEQTYEVTARYKIDDHGKKLAFEDHAPLRMLLPLEMKQMAERNGLQLAGWYGDLRLDQPLDDSDQSWRTVAVFQKGTER
jgi:SAM-dependent methyltransferase